MTRAERGLPASAIAILERGILCHVAASTPFGPHLTPVVYALDGGQLWLTTSRSSVKARAWRRDGTVAGLVRLGDEAVTFRGRVRTYDAFDPLSWPAAAAAGSRLVRAATRFSLKNARFFAGYAVDARRVPLAWMPPGRVFVRLDLLAGFVLRAGGAVPGEAWGEWAPRAAAYARTFSVATPRRLPPVPRGILPRVGRAGEGVAGFEGAGALTVLPVAWARVPKHGVYDAALIRRQFELAGAESGATGALTIDRPSTWRAAEMTGLLLQGPIEAFTAGATSRGVRALRERLKALDAPTGDSVLLRLRPARTVWWQGWSSGTTR